MRATSSRSSSGCAGFEGVAQLADAPSARSDGSIVLADVGDATLRDLPKPLAVEELLALAPALARAVAAMLGRGVMHRDICPAIVVVSSGGRPCLVGFSLATSVPELRLEFVAQSRIEGTPACLAPEQTGRTNRSVDHRADLYALGATLYELATGGPPFGVGDPLRLVHDHLARVPTPPAALNPSLPAAFSQIVLRLLEKEPDNRYQTADGVVYDLERGVSAGLPTASPRSEAACGSRVLRAAARGSLPSSRRSREPHARSAGSITQLA